VRAFITKNKVRFARAEQRLISLFSVRVTAVGFAAQKLQDAQLSQRDRAAGCVIVFAKSRQGVAPHQ